MIKRYALTIAASAPTIGGASQPTLDIDDEAGTAVIRDIGSALPAGEIPSAKLAISAVTGVFQAVINGGAAGNHVVTGIVLGATLVSVLQIDVTADTGTGASGNKVSQVVNRTAEFTVTADNQINNTGGTNTTGDSLLVTWLTR